MSFSWLKPFKVQRQVSQSNTWNLNTYKDGQYFDFSTIKIPYELNIYSENGNQINTQEAEYPEQCIANMYIQEDDVVLELGARYGSVSCIINKKLSNKQNQVSVEPDSTVWSALESNLERNGCPVQVFKGFVSKNTRTLVTQGYGATSNIVESSSIQSKSVEEIESMYGLKFNTLVADCEGFLEEFFEEHPHLFDQLHTVIFEADYPDKCNYDNIRNTLKECGFIEVLSGFQNVYKK